MGGYLGKIWKVTFVKFFSLYFFVKLVSFRFFVFSVSFSFFFTIFFAFPSLFYLRGGSLCYDNCLLVRGDNGMTRNLAIYSPCFKVQICTDFSAKCNRHKALGLGSAPMLPHSGSPAVFRARKGAIFGFAVEDPRCKYNLNGCESNILLSAKTTFEKKNATFAKVCLRKSSQKRVSGNKIHGKFCF